MKWVSENYTITRTRKTARETIGDYTLECKEIYNSKGEEVNMIAWLKKDNIEVTKRYYSETTRDNVIKELRTIASGKTIKYIDAMTGNAIFNK